MAVKAIVMLLLALQFSTRSKPKRLRWLVLVGQTVTYLRLLARKFDLDQSERKCAQVLAKQVASRHRQLASPCFSVWPGLKDEIWLSSFCCVVLQQTIKATDISTVRKLAKPPHLIMRIMDCVTLLFRRNIASVVFDPERQCLTPSWSDSLKVMTEISHLL